MPPREWLFRLRDIVEAVEKVQRYTAGMKFADFADDERTVDAVLRNFTVVGEAAAHLPEAVKQEHPGLPWAEMKGMRNILVHEYFGVSLEIVWETVQRDLPPLIPRLKQILEAS